MVFHTIFRFHIIVHHAYFHTNFRIPAFPYGLVLVAWGVVWLIKAKLPPTASVDPASSPKYQPPEPSHDPAPTAVPAAFHWPLPSETERRDGSYESDDFGVEVVGEANYQSGLAALAAASSDLIASLVPENSNPHDPLAVRVDIQGTTVGYLNRDHARAFRGRLKRKKLGTSITTCEARLAGGHKRRDGSTASIGVKLNIKQFEI